MTIEGRLQSMLYNTYMCINEKNGNYYCNFSQRSSRNVKRINYIVVLQYSVFLLGHENESHMTNCIITLLCK